MVNTVPLLESGEDTVENNKVNEHADKDSGREAEMPNQMPCESVVNLEWDQLELTSEYITVYQEVRIELNLGWSGGFWIKRESLLCPFQTRKIASWNMGIDEQDEEEEVASCGSRVTAGSVGAQRLQRQKLEVYNEVLQRLLESESDEVRLPGFEDHLWIHFNRLPPRYALDVNVERAEDVLIHKRLLKLAEDPANRPVFEVRLVQIYSSTDDEANTSDRATNEGFQSSKSKRGRGIRRPPTFGSSPNLESLVLQEASKSHGEDGGSTKTSMSYFCRPMHEITFSTIDRPKLLSQLTCLLAEIGLNIQEAHAFSTGDGYSLDVFVVDGWDREETENLRTTLEEEIVKFKDQISSKQPSQVTDVEHNETRAELPGKCVEIPNDGDVWEINPRLLEMGIKVASGSFGDLYKGRYCGQEVAIKILKSERVSSEMLREFSQEVYIMRKIRHKNVVQFIGACTKPPNLCIVTEFMAKGSIYDYLHKRNGVFKLSTLIKVALDVSRGMSYLHHNNIIHRDLKTANLVMDENEVVKVTDFGVARVQNITGVMTAETGTYRWMAPEVIEHKPYDHKADVFSFAIVLWELLTGELPYSYLTPLQAAVGVVQKDLRPTIPKQTHPKLAELLVRCWQRDPQDRPDFSEIIDILQLIAKEVADDKKDKHAGGFFSTFMKGNN